MQHGGFATSIIEYCTLHRVPKHGLDEICNPQVNFQFTKSKENNAKECVRGVSVGYSLMDLRDRCDSVRQE
jgi:hypothetical protein